MVLVVAMTADAKDMTRLARRTSQRRLVFGKHVHGRKQFRPLLWPLMAQNEMEFLSVTFGRRVFRACGSTWKVLTPVRFSTLRFTRAGRVVRF